MARKYLNEHVAVLLTQAEFARLGRVLDEALWVGGTNPRAVAAIRLLMLTGCRKREILTLRWADVDLKSRELRLRDSKVGPRVAPLSPSAVRLPAGLPRPATGGFLGAESPVRT